uniref:Uncharacterized protein n=1 Tax=Oryza glumipatula TaxID=40148 RepID=A0A0D9ZUK4_9ORYZ
MKVSKVATVLAVSSAASEQDLGLSITHPPWVAAADGSVWDEMVDQLVAPALSLSMRTRRSISMDASCSIWPSALLHRDFITSNVNDVLSSYSRVQSYSPRFDYK